MSTTTTIHPANSGNNSSAGKKQAAAFAATAASAAGLGVAGARIASELGASEDILTDENVIIDETIEEVAQPDNDASSTGTTSASNSSTSSNTSSTTSNATSTATSTVEPQPITNGDIVEPTVSVESTIEPTISVEPTIEPTVSVEPTIEPTTEIEPEVTVETEPVEQTSMTSSDIVNPDEIAEAIIAEDKIDPNDIDMADVINFDEIGTVYTVDGESYTAAAFHDAAGNDLIMVDVDGDNVFDVITDYDGNYIADVPGNLSVGDAQEDIADDDVYLAYDNEMDNVDEYGDDSLAEDLMA